jgi:subtilisin family serine protease
VLCLAFGNGERETKLEQAVARAIGRDVVVVAGVGNVPISSEVAFPAAYRGVVAAAGVDRSGDHAAVSVVGSEAVLAAPAVSILSTAPDGRYRVGTGTSDATAIIAGAAALVRSKFPKMPAVEVVHRLTATAIDKGTPGRDSLYGYGIVNLVGALTADVPPLSSSASASPPAVPPPNSRFPMALIFFGTAALAAVGLVLALNRLRARTRTA